MSRSWWAKCLLLVFVTVLSLVYVYPTVANLDLLKTRFPFKQKINLGLDLQGGLYLVLGVDFNKVFKDVSDRQMSSFEARAKEKAIPLTSVKLVQQGFPPEDPHIFMSFDPAHHDEAYNLLKKEFVYTLRLVGDKPGELELGLLPSYRQDIRDKTMNQSIEVIRNRIDEFGVSEPSITSQGSDRIVVELPGVKEVERAKDLIGRTAKLEFKIADDKSKSPQELTTIVGDIEKSANINLLSGKFSENVAKINELAKGKIPADDEIDFERVGGTGPNKVGAQFVPYLLHSKTEVTGEDLQDASVQLDPQDGRPNVSFTMSPRGASIFERVTGENIGKRLAIVLDGLVQSAPVIQSKIGARGQITMGRSGGEEVIKEAKDLAIVLRAGALPAQLDFLEQRVIGPSLGADSIHKGAMAALVGSIAVFLFVSFYYRVSGLIATFSLILNVLFVLATLVGLEATLTLPGIAGIALTVGIAVDSNVVIYERIREELRSGKNIHGAVEAGFQKALRTIMDANVTNAIAAIVLLMYGTGPIKGFAVSLLIGIVTTLFTAVFVCKLVFDAYLHWVEARGGKQLSI
jgi:preprotein translocase subunit SecD